MNDLSPRPQASSLRPRASFRAGFTLVEMLVVIVIIGILAALITAAAASALWSAKQTKIQLEVGMLAGGMESFKQKYGSYPPANLCCPKDGSSVHYANPQLLSFVTRAFSRYAATSAAITLASNGMGAASPQAYQIALDLINAGVDVGEFNPQVSLVFWLTGFGPDPTDPFNRNNISPLSRAGFFNFNQAQLMAWSPAQSATGALYPAVPSSTGTLYIPNPSGGAPIAASTIGAHGIGQMVYNAPYGNAAYCYFDSGSYGVLYNATTGNYDGVATNSVTGAGIVYANNPTATGVAAPIEYLNGQLPSIGLYNGTGNVMPYVLDVNSSGGFNIGDTFCKPTSFQIISAGQDGNFGGSLPTVNTPVDGRLYPAGFNYDLPPPLGGSGDDDNVTNFCDRNSLEAAKP